MAQDSEIIRWSSIFQHVLVFTNIEKEIHSLCLAINIYCVVMFELRESALWPVKSIHNTYVKLNIEKHANLYHKANKGN